MPYYYSLQYYNFSAILRDSANPLKHEIIQRCEAPAVCYIPTVVHVFFAKNIDPLRSNSMYCRWEDVYHNSINFVVSHQPPRSAASTVIVTLQAVYNGCIAVFYRLRFTERV